jgi:very-short-patch-repair endonuclease
MTDAERKLWQGLRGRQMDGFKFRRQLPLGPYIVDFVCLEARLVIEVDGGQHLGSAEDKIREAWLASEGFRVLRFWNDEVLKTPKDVLERVWDALHPHPAPAPSREQVDKSLRGLSPSPSRGEGRDGGEASTAGPRQYNDHDR